MFNLISYHTIFKHGVQRCVCVCVCWTEIRCVIKLTAKVARDVQSDGIQA